MTINLLNEYLIETNNLHPDWQWWNVSRDPPDAPKGFIRVKGDVPVGTKKNGRPQWPKRSEAQVFFVEKSKLDEWSEEWGRKNQTCVRCMGSGVVPHGTRLDQVTGAYIHSTVPCPKCRGVLASVRVSGDDQPPEGGARFR